MDRIAFSGSMMVAVSAVLLLVLLSPVAAIAANDDFWDEQLKTVVEQRHSYERELRENPESEWTSEAIEGYLLNSMMCVYYATVFHLWEYREHTMSLNMGFNSGEFGGWPGNPFNGWLPMRVLTVDDEFSPGDLVLQLAPSGYWSYMEKDAGGNFIERPYNFELAVYGPDTEYASYGNAAPYGKNSAWAITPEGALYMIGAWRETADLTDEKHERRRQAAQEHKAAVESDQ